MDCEATLPVQSILSSRPMGRGPKRACNRCNRPSKTFSTAWIGPICMPHRSVVVDAAHGDKGHDWAVVFAQTSDRLALRSRHRRISTVDFQVSALCLSFLSLMLSVCSTSLGDSASVARSAFDRLAYHTLPTSVRRWARSGARGSNDRFRVDGNIFFSFTHYRGLL